MSPEPIQPHPAKQHTWETPELLIDMPTDELHPLQTSENVNDERVPTMGYLPLAQDPADSDSMMGDYGDDSDDDNDNDDDEDDDNDNDDGKEKEGMDHEHECISTLSTTIDQDPPSLPLSEPAQIGSTSSGRSTHIHLDTDKINQVKSMMANFKLPTDTHPPWARTISEDQWKKQLIDRIQQDNHLEISSFCQ